MKGFDKFCINKNYVLLKNSLFNYLNRKKAIKEVFYRNIKNKEGFFLDIGSGISPVTPLPEKTLFMDISRESLNYLRKENLKARYGSVTNLPLKSNSVDVIFCSEVLEHIKDYRKALKEIYRVLRKKGKLILTVPVYRRYWSFDDEFVGHFRRFEPGGFKDELRKTGFRIIEEKPIGSIIERGITKLAVKLFKGQKEEEDFGRLKVFSAKIVNYMLYLIVRFSLLFNSKKSTSIMLYYCEK